jgi:hypothetical protein
MCIDILLGLTEKKDEDLKKAVYYAIRYSFELGRTKSVECAFGWLDVCGGY